MGQRTSRADAQSTACTAVSLLSSVVLTETLVVDSPAECSAPWTVGGAGMLDVHELLEEQEVSRSTERPDVRGKAVTASGNHLWRHVGQCAEAAPEKASHWNLRRHAEITKLDPGPVHRMFEEKILGLDVSVHNLQVV
eukprot:CAMPEP_0181512040 /NCGR_PEP_ID=MMETSP1110-20121109/61759_1 /TAXON_ID=174948 /ORGANISM="Symbiodinium sp., Strain CCMP421" /LENGTH=137 /DNA_ID=CAMNT_0023641825 /DNA_START=217 /DNA_END=632 /DNA_ORIENTATION=+